MIPKDERMDIMYLKCPYCGYEDVDSWEVDEDRGSVSCNDCGKEYYFEREITVSFSSYTKAEVTSDRRFRG